MRTTAYLNAIMEVYRKTITGLDPIRYTLHGELRRYTSAERIVIFLKVIREVTRPSFRAKNNRSKMSKNIIHVEGYDAFKEAANINKEKTVFALFFRIDRGKWK